MIPRLCHALAEPRVSVRVRYGAQLTFSSSAISFVRRQPQRSVGDRAATGRRPGVAEDAVEENKSDADNSEEEEAFDRWLLAGKERVNDSAIRSHKKPYEHFRKNVAPSFREPSPRKWLGRDVPFPLNPSFKPPIPLSDGLRTQLYRAYMVDPKQNSVRALATRHHLSIKRVDAILRLKGMEKSWEKNRTLQTGFTKGMEDLLGVERMKPDTDELVQTGKSHTHDRYDVEEADLQDEADGNNRARQRYQRLFWESVAEGEEPVMPTVLEATRSAASASTKFKGKTTLVKRAPGRPAIMFIDVGNAFVDAKEKERREREGARRSMLKARKRIQKHGLHA